MGIRNIHILTEPNVQMNHSARKMQDYIQAKRTVEHRGGKHPYGQKRRDCPLCQSGK
jgi:hypothetical protein